MGLLLKPGAKAGGFVVKAAGVSIQLVR